MFRKTLIAAAATATLALSIGMATAPAQAVGSLHLSAPVLETQADGSLLQNASHSVLKCSWKRVWVNGYWQRQKKCKKVWPKHYNSY